MTGISGDSLPGNCLKMNRVAGRLAIVHQRTEADILRRESRTGSVLALNPFGQVPVVQFDDGRTLSPPDAVTAHFTQSPDLVPEDAFGRARMPEWMFWGQCSHGTAIAAGRTGKHQLRTSGDAPGTDLMARGRRAPGRMERAFICRDFIAGGAALTRAGIALLACTRLPHEGGFDPGDFPAVQAFAARCEPEPGRPHMSEAAHVQV